MGNPNATISIAHQEISRSPVPSMRTYKRAHNKKKRQGGWGGIRREEARERRGIPEWEGESRERRSEGNVVEAIKTNYANQRSPSRTKKPKDLCTRPRRAGLLSSSPATQAATFLAKLVLGLMPLGLRWPAMLGSPDERMPCAVAGRRRVFALRALSVARASASFFAARSSALLLLRGAMTGLRTGAGVSLEVDATERVDRADPARGGMWVARAVTTGTRLTVGERGSRSEPGALRSMLARLRRGAMEGARDTEATAIDSRRRWPGT